MLVSGGCGVAGARAGAGLVSGCEGASLSGACAVSGLVDGGRSRCETGRVED